MKAAVISHDGALAEYADFPDPVTAEGSELVAVVAAGIHPIVRSLVAGTHYGSSNVWPVIPGVDCVARTASGRLVYAGSRGAPYGTIAEKLDVPPGAQLQLPDNADPVKIAGGLNPGLSSWMPLRASADDGPLGTVLVLGATGMAGRLAVQNAFLLGATAVVAVGRSLERLAVTAGYGAEVVQLVGDRVTDATAIVAALAGRDPSIIVDYLWGPPAEALFAALRRSGLEEDTADIRHVQIGAIAGPEAAVPSSLLRSRRFRLSGSGAGSASLAAIMAEMPAYIGHISDGRVSVPTRTYPLSRVAEAWRASTGGDRVVVVPG